MPKYCFIDDNIWNSRGTLYLDGTNSSCEKAYRGLLVHLPLPKIHIALFIIINLMKPYPFHMHILEDKLSCSLSTGQGPHPKSLTHSSRNVLNCNKGQRGVMPMTKSRTWQVQEMLFVQEANGIAIT